MLLLVKSNVEEASEWSEGEVGSQWSIPGWTLHPEDLAWRLRRQSEFIQVLAASIGSPNDGGLSHLSTVRHQPSEFGLDSLEEGFSYWTSMHSPSQFLRHELFQWQRTNHGFILTSSANT